MHAKLPANRGTGAGSNRTPVDRPQERPTSHSRPLTSSESLSSERVSIPAPRRRSKGRTRLGLAVSPSVPPALREPAVKDHFVRRDGVEFAGTHLIVDLWGGKHLEDIAFIESTLRRCVAASRATLLHIHLHHFGEGAGVSGVAVLAESHISVHTWPERGYAAFDIFMCGAAEPQRAASVLEDAFEPERSVVSEVRRGVV